MSTTPELTTASPGTSPELTTASHETSRRFNALMYTFLAVFVVLLTVCYVYAETVMEWTEGIVRALFM